MHPQKIEMIWAWACLLLSGVGLFVCIKREYTLQTVVFQLGQVRTIGHGCVSTPVAGPPDPSQTDQDEGRECDVSVDCAVVDKQCKAGGDPSAASGGAMASPYLQGSSVTFGRRTASPRPKKGNAELQLVSS